MVTANENLMGTVSISYLPAIQAAKQFSVSLEQLNMQLKNHQALARQTGVITAAGLATQYNQQGIILDRYGRTLVDTNRKMETVTQAAQRQKKTVQDLANSHSFLQHRMGWFISGSAFYGAINAAGQAAKAIKDVEMGMVELARISDDAAFDFNEMRTELLQLGIDYGRNWEEVQDIALRWAQAGYNISDTLELTKSSLLALNTAELDAANATQSMIGIMAQWGLQAEDLLLVIDKINKTADDYSVSSQDLVDGLLRSSGAARIMGMSLEQTISLLTVMREASGRTGREVGNALNSILSYIQRPSSIKTLEGLGIQVFADEARTQFRNVMETFADIAAKWPSLSAQVQDGFVQAAEEAGLYSEELATAIGLQKEWNDLQQRDIAQSAAGIYRRNYFIGMIQRLSEAQDVLNNMMDAAGYSMRENERTMEALEMKVQALKTAFVMLAVEIGEAGLLDVMKSTVDTTREWIETFEQLPPEFKKLIIMLGETAAVMGIVNLTSKTFLNIKLVDGIKDLAVKFAGANKETVSFGGALLALAKTPVGMATIAFLALGTAVYQFAKWQDEANIRAAESIQTSIDSAKRANAQADEIEKLAGEYEKLAQKETRTAEETAKLESITKDLIELMPGLASRFDEAKTAAKQYGDITQYTTDQLRRLREEAREDIAFAARVATSNIDSAKKEMDELKAKQDEIRAAYDSDDPIATLFDLHIKYGDRVLDNISVKSPFISQEERAKRAKDAIRQWAKEAEEEYKAAKEIYEKHWQAINLQAELNQDSWLKRDRMGASSGGSGGSGGSGSVLGSGLVAGLTEAERILAKQGYYRHLLNMGQISTEEYILALEDLERQLVTVGVKEEDLWSIQEEIYSLRTRENKKALDDMYSNAMDYYNHEVNLARMSRDEQIRYLQDLSRQHEWEKEKMWRLEEQLFRLYQDRLSTQSEAIDKAYNDRIDEIERSAERRIARIQAKIDALEEEQEDNDREEQERQHNEKVKELEQELRYHQLRTGAEHSEAIVDIEKRIEEENRRWKQQLDKWETDDRKRSLQRQIKDIQDAAKEEKEVWKRKYQDIKKEWDKWKDEFASAALTDPKWLEIGTGIGQQIVDGFAGSISQLDGINFPGIGGQPGVDQEFEKVKQLAKEQGGQWVYVNKDLYGKMIYWSGDTIRFSGGKGGVFTMTPDEYRALKEIDGVKVSPNYKPPSSGGGNNNPPGGGDSSPSKSWHANWIDEKYLTEEQKAAKAYALQQFGDLNEIAYGKNGLIEKISNATTEERIKQIKDYAKSIGIALNYFHTGLRTGIYTGGQRFDQQTASIAKMLLNFDPSRESLIKTLKDEVVLTKQQFLNIPKVFARASLGFNFEKLITALRTSQMPALSAKEGDVIFNGPLFNAEKVQFEDRQDMEILSREIFRQVKKIK